MIFQKTILFLFEKDLNKFSDFLKIGFFDPIYHSQIFIFIIRKNMRKLISHPELFSFIYSDKMDSKKYISLNNTIVKYILNKAEVTQYSNLDIINNSFIFKDLDSALLSLNDIYNKNATIFVLNKIQKLFEEINTNNKLFLELIKRQVNNNYVFDYLFNSFNDNDINELFKNNQDKIILSLYKYSETNGYKYIQLCLDKLYKFMPKEDLNGLICPSFGRDYTFPEFINSFIEEQNKKIELSEKKTNDPFYYLKDINYKDEETKKREKYLLIYASSNQMIINYETIALLLEYCPFEYGINYLLHMNSIKMMNLLEYISNNSNKNKLKDIGNHLIKCLELFEKFYKALGNYSINLNNMEKIAFYYYLIIIVLQITPEELILFMGIDDKVLNFDIFSKKNNQRRGMPEAVLFVILAFYEIKGNPILPIKKYLPTFFSNIEKLYDNFEKLGIPKINSSKDIDNKLYEHCLYLIKEKTEEHLERILYSYYKNYYLIILKETKMALKQSFENNMYIEPWIFNLIENEKEYIKPFYLNNEIDKFFSNIYTFQYIIYGQIHEHWNIEVLSKKEIKKRRYKEWNEKEKIIDYKTIIYSLSDFNATSTYILQNNANLMEKYHWEDETPLSIYAIYLKVIKYLYHYIKQRKSHKYGVNIIEEYQLSEKEKIKLNDIKNNINLNKIIQL